MSDDPPYRLDVEGTAPSDGGRGVASGVRPWLGILFECCHVYTRVYRDPSGTVYEGRCPKCTRPVRLRVGEDGTDARFFAAS